MFANLFSPIKINKTEIKNRIIFPAMGLLYSMDQKLNDRYIDFYLERARGGAGIVTVGPVGIGELGVGLAAPSIETDEAIPSFAQLARRIKDTRARAWIQLYHGGGYVRPVQIGGQQPVAPSALYSKFSGSHTKGMTVEKIKNLQEAYVRCALRAQAAGFDGVEILAAAGYLICQFLSPLTNHRTDEYGGRFENRVRFPREIIEKMRKRLGPDFPLTIRIAGNDFVPGSNTSAEIPAFARVYEKAGIDAINVTGGWHEAKVPQLTADLPRGGFAYLAQNIKNVVSVPVMASNRITDPFTAEQIIKDGLADMINLGRVLMADPYWPVKAKNGHPEQMCPCVACLQGCMDELFNLRPAICTVNPRAGFEGERRITRTEKPRQVMVIGAGPGGMEAALRAAEAGHKVELYEKSTRIGGQLWIAGAPPHKQELWEIIKYYENMLPLSGVDIFVNTPVDLELIQARQPDFIIAAEGARLLVPDIEGINDACVISAWDVLAQDISLGRKIAVIGGGAVGLETAHYIAMKGTIAPATLEFLFRHEAESVERLRQLLFQGNKEVTVFEMMPQVGQGVGKSTRWGLFNSLQKHGVNIITSARVISIQAGKLTFAQDGQHQTMQFDQVINAAGSQPVRAVADVLEKTGIPFAVIGDSVKPAQILDAIHAAYLTVMHNL